MLFQSESRIFKSTDFTDYTDFSIFIPEPGSEYFFKKELSSLSKHVMKKYSDPFSEREALSGWFTAHFY